MLLVLAVLAAVETAPPPAVEMTLSGSGSAPVSAERRTLSDVAKERRLGRRATGGFSAVETTVTSAAGTLPAIEWIEPEEERREPEVAPEPQPPGWVVPYGPGWIGGIGGSGGSMRHRPPHVAHHGGRPMPHPGRQPEAAPRRGAPQVSRSAARPLPFSPGPIAAAPVRPGRRG